MEERTPHADGEPEASGGQPLVRVRLPRSGLPAAAMVIAALVLALALFALLNQKRRRLQEGAVTTPYGAFPPPPPLIVPPDYDVAPQAARPYEATPSPSFVLPPSPPSPVPAPVPFISPAPQAVAAPATRSSYPPQQPAEGRRSEPAIVFDAGSADAANAGSQSGKTQGASTSTGDDAPARVTVIGDQTTVMPVGTIIPAVLETPIDSARPGLVRAITSEDTRGFDGKRVLVPRGSRLIGEYQSDVRSGQSRVLVTWTRLIRPDGVAIRIGSPAADALGGAGIPGHVNTFFFQRFASALLQSALTVGVNLASRPGSGSVIVGLPSSSLGTVGQSLLPESDLRPKIKVPQGAVVKVFVARDLDFSGAPAETQD